MCVVIFVGRKNCEMVEYIPFITSPRARDLVKSIYSDAQICRVSLEWSDKIAAPGEMKLWIDSAVDGFDDLESRKPRKDKKKPEKERKNRWYEVMKTVPGFEQLGDPSFATKPDPRITKSFVNEVLDRCARPKPAWITVPQLPIVNDASRNKINRALAKATAEWKSARGFAGKLILPLLFTHQHPINGKTQRKPKVQQTDR